MLACYCVSQLKMAAPDAIAHVRKLRPGSVATARQQQAVKQFGKHLDGKLTYPKKH
jgi:hypothetical protein